MCRKSSKDIKTTLLTLISSVAVQKNDKYQLTLHDVITSSAIVRKNMLYHTYLEIEKFFLPQRPFLPRLPLCAYLLCLIIGI